MCAGVSMCMDTNEMSCSVVEYNVFCSTTASTTVTSSFASSASAGAGPRVPHPPPTSYPHDTGRAAKRRKVASAPPPQTYTGFSSVRTGARSGSGSGAPSTHGKATTVSWKPNLESVGSLPLSVAPPGGGAPRFSSQPTSDSLDPKGHQHVAASKRTRKVHRVPTSSGTRAAGSEPGAQGSSLITTSSWRVGKELTDKILKGDDQGRVRVRPTMTDHHGGREAYSPNYSSDSESHLNSSQENISTLSSSFDAQPPERSQFDEPLQSRLDQLDMRYSVSPGQRGGTRMEEGSGSHGGLTSDVAGLLEDLEAAESPVPPRGGGGGRREEKDGRARLGQARSAGGGPVSKKPRYNFGEHKYVHDIVSMYAYMYMYIYV